MAYFMDKMTVDELKEVIETKRVKTVIIPVGVVEQHGYHLPLSTDIHNATEVPKRAGERLKAVVAPTIPYCYSGGELTGTVNVSPQVFSLYVMDICGEFVRMGFENVVVFLGHGGTDNKAALESCLKTLLRRMPESESAKITFSLVGCWELSPLWMSYFNMTPEHDFHAGLAETSLMMYWHPELVKKENICTDTPEISRMMRTDCDWYEVSEKKIDHKFMLPRTYQRKEIEVGVMGFPEKASPEIGGKISNEMIDGLIEYIEMLNRETG